MHWIPEGTLLKGELVTLMPLDPGHYDELVLLATEKRIWEHIPVDMSNAENCLKALRTALVNKENETEYPFIIYHKAEQKIIGSTRLMEISQPNKKLEIGWTWLHPDYWATAINLDCKLTLLTYCFEVLGAIRVQLKTDENNIRSRTAITKIGAKFEGILRKDRIRDNGTVRNTAYFSILDTEWSEVKISLTGLRNNKMHG